MEFGLPVRVPAGVGGDLDADFVSNALVLATHSHSVGGRGGGIALGGRGHGHPVRRVEHQGLVLLQPSDGEGDHGAFVGVGNAFRHGVGNASSRPGDDHGGFAVGCQGDGPFGLQGQSVDRGVALTHIPGVLVGTQFQTVGVAQRVGHGAVGKLRRRFGGGIGPGLGGGVGVLHGGGGGGHKAEAVGICSGAATHQGQVGHFAVRHQIGEATLQNQAATVTMTHQSAGGSVGRGDIAVAQGDLVLNSTHDAAHGRAAQRA